MVGKTLPYDSADALRESLRAQNPIFAGMGYAPGHEGAEALKEKISASSSGNGSGVGNGRFTPAIGDFYMTNPIARASKTMAECSLQKQGLATPVAAE